jgi:hypothetical protein
MKELKKNEQKLQRSCETNQIQSTAGKPVVLTNYNDLEIVRFSCRILYLVGFTTLISADKDIKDNDNDKDMVLTWQRCLIRGLHEDGRVVINVSHSDGEYSVRSVGSI